MAVLQWTYVTASVLKIVSLIAWFGLLLFYDTWSQ